MFCSVCGTEIDRAYLCPKCDSEFCLTHLPEEAHRCGAPPPPLPNHSFGIPSLMFSWVALSIAGYAVYNLSFSAPGGPFHVPGWENFTIIFFIFGPALVLHESMHIVAGRRFGYPAGFEIWQFGIILMLVVAMVGFLFAAPGATVINTDKQHPLSTTETGIIAFSGPLTNLILACLGGHGDFDRYRFQPRGVHWYRSQNRVKTDKKQQKT